MIIYINSNVFGCIQLINIFIANNIIKNNT